MKWIKRIFILLFVIWKSFLCFLTTWMVQLTNKKVLWIPYIFLKIAPYKWYHKTTKTTENGSQDSFSAPWWSCRCPCSLWGSWTRWPLVFPFSSNDSMILWFIHSMQIWPFLGGEVWRMGEGNRWGLCFVKATSGCNESAEKQAIELILCMLQQVA